jgi:hypothetical protein
MEFVHPKPPTRFVEVALPPGVVSIVGAAWLFAVIARILRDALGGAQ